MFILRLVVKFIYFEIFINKTFSINISQWNNIKKETKNILENNWKQARGTTQIGPKPGSFLDYPGIDQAKIRQNIELWDLYYKCLKEQNLKINIKHIFPAKVIKTLKSFSPK